MQVIPGFAIAPEAATRLLQFVNASPTPFHAVHNAALRLEKAGFTKVCVHLSRSYMFSQPL
jgi:aspartyl aminopeptidase